MTGEPIEERMTILAWLRRVLGCRTDTVPPDEQMSAFTNRLATLPSIVAAPSDDEVISFGDRLATLPAIAATDAPSSAASGPIQANTLESAKQSTQTFEPRQIRPTESLPLSTPSSTSPTSPVAVSEGRLRVRARPEWHYVAAGREVIVIDTETTGLTREDRIASFGAVVLSADELRPIQAISLVFNPGRPSHPMAKRVHGLCDEFLRRQPTFVTHAAAIKALLRGRVVVGHNLSFDLRMLDQDFVAAGFPMFGGKAGRYCTMNEWRHRFPGGSAKLSMILETLGLPRQGDVHGAIQDAASAAMVLQFLHGYERIIHPPVTGAGFQNAV